MGLPKAKSALERLGQDVRSARLRRNMAVADLAVRAGTSPSSIARLEKGDAGVATGTFANVLVVLGLVERLADLIDVGKDDLVLALAAEHLPRRGRSFAAKLRKQQSRSGVAKDQEDVVDPDGVGF